MKLNFDVKNKKAGFEADVEKLLEKGIEQHEKDWKDKFNTKHNAKKEMLEIKHKQRIELEEKNQTKKNWIQKIQEENRRIKELELEDKRRMEEEERKILKLKMIISIISGIIGIIMMVVGYLLGSTSGDSNSGWYMMSVVGFFPLIGAGFSWMDGPEKKK